MKEYQLFWKLDGEDLEKSIDVLYAVLANKRFALLNIEAFRSELNTILDYIILKVRFDKLYDEAGGDLRITKDGFQLAKHTFATLDEVEKAIKNKAFL